MPGGPEDCRDAAGESSAFCCLTAQGLRSTEDRIRASWLCTALVALGNGIPFFHAGAGESARHSVSNQGSTHMFQGAALNP